MKALLSLLLLTAPAWAASKVMFHALIDHSTGHELTWSFSAPVKNWGKTDQGQVLIACNGRPLEKPSKIFWANAQTLKLLPAINFTPGEKCEATLNLADHKQTDTISVPLATVKGNYPYGQDITEDNVFVLGLDANVDDDLLASTVYMEIEGMREKIEFDAVKGDLKQELIKNTYIEGDHKVILKPRRRYPYGKKFVLHVPQKYTYAYEIAGNIRDDFKLLMKCERPAPGEPCSPVSKIQIEFNSEVQRDVYKKVSLSDGKTKWKVSPPDTSYVQAVSFDAQLKPSTEYSLTIESGIEDNDGRSLSNSNKFPLKFKTGPYPPLAKFPGGFGILEAHADPVIPVSVRNVEKEITLKKTATVLSLNNPKIFGLWLSAIQKRQDVGYGDSELRAKSIFAGSPIATKNETISYSAGKNEIEVLGLPAKAKGLHLVELHSPKIAKSLLQNEKDFYISTAVLVTNLVAHMKIAETESMVWVTTLDKGEVVPGAEVILYDCNGNALGKGVTNAKGLASISQASKKDLECSGNIESFNYKMVAVAKKGDDATFTLSSWAEGIENWRFNVPYYYGSEGQDKGHTVFDRPIYKVNEKVSMLHLLRSQGDNGLIYSKQKYSHIRITHADSNQEWFVSLKWKDAGTAASEFKIPENAPQGVYYVGLVKLSPSKAVENLVSAGEFIVKDFRIPLMRSEVHFLDKKERYSSEEELRVLGRLDYLAGGAAGHTPVTLRGEIVPYTRATVKDYPDHVFNFAGIDENYDYTSTTLEKKLVRTDKDGNFSFTLNNLPKSKSAVNLSIEIEYLDPNGIYQTNTTSTRVYPFSTVIGIKNPENVFADKEASFGLVLLDLKDSPLKRATYSVTLYKERYISTRKKIIGGFYTYDTSTKREEVGEVCAGRTDEKGQATCKIKVSESGSHYLVVTSKGATGKTQFYSYGKDYAWAPQEHHDRIDLIPEKKEYTPGEMAKIGLKLPFEKATVLITKERAGVKESYVTPYDRTNPFLLVPIETSDFPNFFLSALAVRGRVGTPAPTGLVDLARPAYKMGLQEIKVERTDHNLKIVLTPEKDQYQVRDRVKLKVKVTTLDGSPLGQTRVAVSVFDEGLLLLNGQNSFNAAQSLIQSYSHGVQTATAQTHVIGKRHFGLKARPHGGGGGKDLKPRELFDTLIYWNPALALNKNGEAEVEFTLNDSLTSFKIYGLAYSLEKFGNSNTRITASQDIMTFVGTSPEIRTGDDFSASYAFKNISTQDKSLRGEIILNGKKIYEESFLLKAGDNKQVSVPVTAFTSEGVATYQLNLYDGKKKIDSIQTTQKISPLETPRVLFSDLKEISTPVEVAGVTTQPRLFGTEILLSPSLRPSLNALQSYMKNYPYSCLEQTLARAMILEDKKLFQKIERDLPGHIDARGFLKYYPTSEIGSILLTTYFLEMNFFNKVSTNKDVVLVGALKTFIDGNTVGLVDWEKKEFNFLKQKAMVALKLLKTQEFSPKWVNEISPALPTDSIDTLMDKWVLFYPGEKAKGAHELIQNKLKIDGSSVSLASRDLMGYDFLYSLDNTVLGRFLLLQKTLPLETAFSKFYQDNEPKFIRGYMGQRKEGHFGGTTANSYAYLLQKLWQTKTPVTGKTTVANTSSIWREQAAQPLLLSKDQAKETQTLRHEGTGTPWADIRTFVYPEKEAVVSQGISVRVDVKNLEPHSDFQVQDRIEAKITIEVKNNFSMGALQLPLPSGVSILEAASDLFLSYEERTESKWRGYFDQVPKGKYELTIIFRLNHPGAFEVPGARMEAMYSPDVFGEAPFWKMKVK